MSYHLARARRVDNGEWVIGFPLNLTTTTETGDRSNHWVICQNITDIIIKIDPQTIAPCTGWPDKENKLVFFGYFFEDDGNLFQIVLDPDDFQSLALKVEIDGPWVIDGKMDKNSCKDYVFFDNVEFLPDGSWRRVEK